MFIMRFFSKIGFARVCVCISVLCIYMQSFSSFAGEEKGRLMIYALKKVSLFDN